jgi:hypothetical protein
MIACSEAHYPGADDGDAFHLYLRVAPRTWTTQLPA